MRSREELLRDLDNLYATSRKLERQKLKRIQDQAKKLNGSEES